MFHIRFLIAVALCCLWLVPSTASAAPFCVEAPGIPPECWYHDIQHCKQAAERRNGYCSANQKEMDVADMGAPYCVVDSSGVPVCAFQGGESCHEAAARQGGVCFQNTGGDPLLDPYRFDRAPYRIR